MKLFIPLLCLLAFSNAMLDAAIAGEPRTLDWEDLLPEGEIERIEKMTAILGPDPIFEHFGSGQFEAPGIQIGTFNVVQELNGELVRIPGFVLPFEYESTGKITEFLLVPYFGACIHVPPPPPNQMVYVKSKKPVDIGKVWDAVYVTGILRTEKHLHGIGDAAYTLEFEGWERYD